MMTRITAAIWAALMLVCVSAGAKEPYFCTRQGAKLNYVRTICDGGDIRWRHEMNIISVSGTKTRNISYSSTFTKKNGASMYGGPIQLSAVIEPNGDVKVDLASSIASIFSNYIGSRNISSAGGSTELPSDMKPGDILPDAECSVSASIAKMNVKVTDRKVLRKESLKTPAGTFDCIVVEERKTEKGTMHNRSTTSLTWYARGVGMVRHDTFDKNGKQDTSEVLQSIK